MPTPYQLLILGAESKFRTPIQKLFNERTRDLGLDQKAIEILKAGDFSEYKSNAPAVCIYFGGDPSKDVSMIETLVREGCIIIPVVENLKKYSELVPSCLRPINGFEINNSIAENKPPALVSRILEGLGLLRKTRKLFISYRRIESRSVALQLYESLDSAGFNVFLDTHSVGPGSDFQNELWHSLADTDVLLLLNTENFVGNKWTDAELTKATSMSVGITQLVWPGCNKKAYIDQNAFATPIYLTDNSFENTNSTEPAKLTQPELKKIEKEVESLRARAHAARQDNLIKEFIRTAANRNIVPSVQSDKVIIVTRLNGEHVAVIPAVGVPDAYTSFEKQNLINKVFQNDVDYAVILYDHRNILEEYLKFVDWLDPLPVKYLRIMEAEEWLTNLKPTVKIKV
jgi:hypothetical protein